MEQTMNSKKLHYLLLAGCGLVLLLSGAAIYKGNELLKTRSDKLYNLKAESLTLAEQQKTLVQAKKDIETYSEIESIARTVVPQEKDQARTVREIIAIANRTGVSIANISFPSSTLGTQDKKKKTESTNTTQLVPVEGIPGVYELEINVQTDANQSITYETLLGFLGELEQNRRTSQVKSLTITPSAEDRSRITFNVVLSVYIKL
jgi:uncharacterized protein YerC